jgi:hypothetical protein
MRMRQDKLASGIRHCPTTTALLPLLVMAAIGCEALQTFFNTVDLQAWRRHVIDDSSRGADGVRLADADGDGLLDIATPWEQGGLARVYVNPGPELSQLRWPAVTVGRVASPEDAVLVDLDGDGSMDVVSCCEGDNRTIFVHWAPRDSSRYLFPAAWDTQAIPITADAEQWMFCLPLQVDGRSGIDLVVGAKGDGARIGWLESPDDPRSLADWRWHPLYEAGWIMSLRAADVDEDGDPDIVASDRKGPTRGCLWLENPGPGPAQYAPWQDHRIGQVDKEVMFLDLVDLDRDGLSDVLAATRGPELLYHRRLAGVPAWKTYIIQMPAGTGTGKAVKAGDLDLDGRLDIVVTCENADGKSGVVWMRYLDSPTDSIWQGHEISGTPGAKFDLADLLDIDADGDLDVVTCEEGANLGVLWYENPVLQ